MELEISLVFGRRLVISLSGCDYFFEMSKIITAQMMNDLSYTCNNQMSLQKLADKASFDDEIRTLWVFPINVSEILGIIKKNINTLAKIESEDNYVPIERAKQGLESGMIVPSDMDTIKQNIWLHDINVTAQHVRPISSVIENIIAIISTGVNELHLHFDGRRERFVKYLLEILGWETKVSSKEDLEEKYLGSREECSMFLFRASDLEAAIHYLNQSMKNPADDNRVKILYVQEAILDSFRTKLQRNLHYYPHEVRNDPSLRQRFKETMRILKKLNAAIIRPLNATEDEVTPVVCYEFDLSYFPPNSPVVVLKVFRTVKEAISLAKKDRIRKTSIWTENSALSFEIVKNLDCQYFWINCLGVKCNLWRKFRLIKDNSSPRKVFEIMGESGVSIENSHHFEYFTDNDVEKFVAFPIGTTFAN